MGNVCIEKLRSLFCNQYNPYLVQRKNNTLINQIMKIKALQGFLFFYGRKLCKTGTVCFPSDESEYFIKKIHEILMRCF